MHELVATARHAQAAQPAKPPAPSPQTLMFPARWPFFCGEQQGLVRGRKNSDHCRTHRAPPHWTCRSPERPPTCFRSQYVWIAKRAYSARLDAGTSGSCRSPEKALSCCLAQARTGAAAAERARSPVPSRRAAEASILGRAVQARVLLSSQLAGFSASSPALGA